MPWLWPWPRTVSCTAASRRPSYDRSSARPAIGHGRSSTPTCGERRDHRQVDEHETIDCIFSKPATSATSTRSATAKWGELAARRHLPVHLLELRLPDTFTPGERHAPGHADRCCTPGSGRPSCPVTRHRRVAARRASSTAAAADVGRRDAHRRQGNSFGGTTATAPISTSTSARTCSSPSGARRPCIASIYTITSLVGFHVLGWSGNGSDTGATTDRRIRQLPDHRLARSTATR